jgi:hypothetical protein
MLVRIFRSLTIYSFLSLVQVFISFANLFFLYKCFGKSSITAVYFISTTIVGSILLILITLTDQFVYHYLNFKTKSKERAETFFNTTILISIIAGGVLGVVIIFFPSVILEIFAKNLSSNDHQLAAGLIQYPSLFIFTFSGPLNLIQSKLNVDGKILLSYLMAMLPLITQLFAWIILYYQSIEITFIFWAQSAGIVLSILIFIIYYWKNLTLTVSFKKNILSMISDSIKIRTAHNLHNFFLNYLISNSLSASHPTITTIFFTVKRFFEALQQILIGPIQKTFPNVIKKSFESNSYSIQSFFSNHIKLSFQILILSIVIAFVSLVIFIWSPYNTFFGENNQFLIFCIFCYLIITFSIFQEIPFTLFIMSQSKSLVIYRSNILFLIQLFIILNLASSALKEYLLVFSILLGQIIILISNKFSAYKLLLNFKSS